MKKYLTIVLSLTLIWVAGAGCKKTVIEQITQTIADTSGNKLPEYIITDYGAVADGKTDCGPVINKIITSLPASGGSIVIPEGEFLLNTTIMLNRNYVTIRGLNPGLRSNVDVSSPGLQSVGGGSKLIIGSALTGINIPVLPDVNGSKNRISGIVIKDLIITGGTTTHGTGINILQDNDGVRISNFIGINLATGIYSSASDAMNIISCWISECKNSIYLSNGVQNTITNCQLGAQPGGITVRLDNQQNFNFTGNQVYPDGDVNLQLNNSTYVNVTSNNFQSYYVGMIETTNSDYNLISSNIFWLRVPSTPARQLRTFTNDYGIVRLSGNGNLFTANTITCNWSSPTTNPVTIRSLSGNANSYQGIKFSDITSTRVFYVNETSEIINCVPSSKVYVDGDPTKVTIKY